MVCTRRLMRLLVLFVLAGAAVALTPSSYKPFAVLADLMAGILLPNSDVQAVMETAKGAQKVALTKDPDAVFTACDPLNEVCFTRHEAYRSCPTRQEDPPKGQIESPLSEVQ